MLNHTGRWSVASTTKSTLFANLHAFKHVRKGSIRNSFRQQAASKDITGSVVNPAFRSTPWAAEAELQKVPRHKARLLFVGESNACRSVLAESIMKQILQLEGLDDMVEVESKGTRNYSLGHGPEASVLAVAPKVGVSLPEGFAARLFDHAHDIVAFDMVLVMDKFTAADVLREVASYDLINRSGGYSVKVRRLGDFHPVLGKKTEPDAQDIDDPLYGNVGGEEEEAAVMRAAVLVRESCEGLAVFLNEVMRAATQRQQQQQQQGSNGSAALDDKQQEELGNVFISCLKERVQSFDAIQWLVPPMLRGRTSPLQPSQ